MIKVAFLTKNLDIGGIERAILNYLNYMNKLINSSLPLLI